jgi:hypothetical protein
MDLTAAVRICRGTSIPWKIGAADRDGVRIKQIKGFSGRQEKHFKKL